MSLSTLKIDIRILNLDPRYLFPEHNLKEAISFMMNYPCPQDRRASVYLLPGAAKLVDNCFWIQFEDAVHYVAGRGLRALGEQAHLHGDARIDVLDTIIVISICDRDMMTQLSHLLSIKERQELISLCMDLDMIGMRVTGRHHDVFRISRSQSLLLLNI
jgi:hypothetical protein